jgi:hypothetical protein
LGEFLFSLLLINNKQRKEGEDREEKQSNNDDNKEKDIASEYAYCAINLMQLLLSK